MTKLRVAILLAVLAAAPQGRADTDDLRVNLRLDLAVTAAAAAGAVGVGSLELASSGCGLCGSDALDEEAREVLRLGEPRAARNARLASDHLVSILLPAGALAASGVGALRDGSPRHLLEDVVVVAESAAIAANLNALAKATLGRQRPGSGAGDAANRSFYSSHASRAFALAVSSATVATIRGRRGARWMWVAGLTIATGVAYLRVASDSHWLTDVAAGAAAGGAIGFAVPWYLHRAPARRRRFDVTPAPGGLAIAF
jgi:membrane-associated phospholipid phosphatase